MDIMKQKICDLLQIQSNSSIEEIPKTEVKNVYDILNSGRRNRFTVSGKLVHNCLYGVGDNQLGNLLNTTPQQAKRVKGQYYSKLQKVKDFMRRVVSKADKGKISNIAGRIYRFDRRFSYKAVNYLIQGSSSEITKSAMIACEEILKPYKSKLILSVHDELIFYLHNDEHFLVEKLAHAMRSAYTHTILPMDVGIEIGQRWSEMREYVPKS